MPPAVNISVDKEFKCGICVKCTKNRLLNHLASRDSRLYYLLFIIYKTLKRKKPFLATWRCTNRSYFTNLSYFYDTYVYDTYVQTLLKLTFSVCDKYHLYLAARGSELPLFNCSKSLSKYWKCMRMLIVAKTKIKI